MSDHLGFVLQFVDQLINGLDLDAGTAGRRGFDLDGAQSGGRAHAQLFRLGHVQRLLLGLHDVRQGGVARLVQAQVSGDNGWQFQLNGLQTAVDFTGDLDALAFHVDFRGEGALGVAAQCSQHLAGLVVIGVDGLLAEDDQLGLFLVDHRLEQLGDGQGVQLISGLDQNGTVGTQGQGGTQLLLGSGRAYGDGNDFGCNTFFLQAYGFFHGNFAEGVHGHLDVGEVDTAVVRFDANLDVVVNHALYGNEDFHGR